MSVIEREIRSQKLCFRGIDSASAGAKVENNITEFQSSFECLYRLTIKLSPEVDLGAVSL